MTIRITFAYFRAICGKLAKDQRILPHIRRRSYIAHFYQTIMRQDYNAELPYDIVAQDNRQVKPLLSTMKIFFIYFC
jgi:hypothetical protein